MANTKKSIPLKQTNPKTGEHVGYNPETSKLPNTVSKGGYEKTLDKTGKTLYLRDSNKKIISQAQIGTKQETDLRTKFNAEKSNTNSRRKDNLDFLESRQKTGEKTNKKTMKTTVKQLKTPAKQLKTPAKKKPSPVKQTKPDFSGSGDRRGLNANTDLLKVGKYYGKKAISKVKNIASKTGEYLSDLAEGKKGSKGYSGGDESMRQKNMTKKKAPTQMKKC